MTGTSRETRQDYGTYQPDEATPNGHKALRRIDLGTMAARPHARPTLHEHRMYPAKLHVIGGEPGHGKSTVMIWWLLRAIANGHPVVLFDWEAGSDHTADLLQSFGAEPSAVSKYLHYFPHPDLAWSAADIAEVATELKAIRPVITAFDSSIAVLSAMGGNENSPTDVRRMWNRIAPIAHTLGCAVIATDHSGKEAGESRYNRGSTDKLAAVDVNHKLNAIRQFSRHQDGLLELTCTKDRPGWLHWNWEIRVTRSPLELHWKQVKAKAPGGGAAAESLAAVLNHEPASIKLLVDRIVARGGVPLKPNTAYKALTELADNGNAEKIDQGAGLPVLWLKPQPPPEPGPEQGTLGNWPEGSAGAAATPSRGDNRA
jgi:hypothetical protein